MARANSALEFRLVTAALWRGRGQVALAVLAVSLGSAVAAALLHLSGDVDRQVRTELRALGPNLLLVPETAERSAPGAGARQEYLAAAEVERRLAAAGIEGTCVLAVAAHAEVAGHTIEVPVLGADLSRLRRLHPGWRLTGAAGDGWLGEPLAARLAAGRAPIVLHCESRSIALTPGTRLVAGGSDDGAWWIPLADAQRLAGLPDAASFAAARLTDPSQTAAAVAALERGGGVRAVVVHALSETEAGLLKRMRRLMALVTAAALLAAGLCALGTLTDLALDRRKEIALMKSLGASRADVVRLFAGESLAIGSLGGLLGSILGALLAAFIGRSVFHAAVALDPRAPLIVFSLSLAVAAVAALGPVRLALTVEPARALRGDE